MRISDWSSDVCSSDLQESGDAGKEGKGKEGERARDQHIMPKLCDAGQPGDEFGRVEQRFVARRHARKLPDDIRLPRQNPSILLFSTRLEPSARKSVGSGKRVSVRYTLGGRRIIKKKNQ